MNEKQIRQTAGVSAHLALPGPVGAGGDQQADGWSPLCTADGAGSGDGGGVGV